MYKRQKYFSVLLFILLVGAIVRVLFLLFWSKTPYFSNYFLDELYHHLWAQRIACGKFLPDGVFFRAPFYPYIIGGIYAIFGDGALAPRIFQHLWGLIAAVPMFFVAREIFKSEKIALLSSLLWVLYPMQIFYESRLLLDSFFSAGVVWLIWFLILIPRKRTPFLCALAGFWLGILAITRPTILIIVPVVLIYVIKFVKWRAIITALAMLLPIAPITISNAIQGDFVLIASQGGINFYIGNNPECDGASAIVPELGRNWHYRQCVKIAEEQTGNNLKPSAVSRFFYRKGFDFWRKNTGRAIKLFFKKMVLLFTSPEIGNNGNIYFLLRGSFLKKFLWVWALIVSLALAGFLFAKFEHKCFFAAMTIFYALVVVSFFMCSRFRLPMIPMLIIPATAGIKLFFEGVKKRRIVAIIFALCVFILSLFDPYNWRRDEDALSHFALGNIFLRSAKSVDAEREYREALELDSRARGVYLNLGAIMFRRGLLDSAKIYFRREIDVGGEICRAEANLGVIERLEHNYMLALHWGGKSLEDCIAEPSAVFNYAMTLFEIGYYSVADSLLRAQLPEFSDNLRLLNLAGATALAVGDTARAESLWTKIIADKSRSFVELYDLGTIYSEQSGFGAGAVRIRSWAYYNLAQISAVRGDIDRASELLNLAVAQDKKFAQGFSSLGAIALAENDLKSAERYLLRAEKLGLKSPELYFNLASVSARKGDMEGAKKFLTIALELNPDFTMAKQALDALKNQ